MPGPSTATAIVTGARSAGSVMFGHAWKFVASTRYCGLKFAFGLVGWPGSFATNRYTFGHGPAGSGQLYDETDGTSISNEPLRSVWVVKTFRPLKS